MRRGNEKRQWSKPLTGVFIFVLIISSFAFSFLPARASNHLVIGWNDLGMHCSNKDFHTLSVLPPYNNLLAQVIKRGSVATSPSVVTNQLALNYEIPGNTYSVGKTDFWDYVYTLFGVSLPPNIGLTGNGLSGNFQIEGPNNFFEATGIPLTPFIDSDLVNEDPYQLATVRAIDNYTAEEWITRTVIPVSNEINCVSSGCHSSEAQILAEHEGGKDESSGDVRTKNSLTAPVLCANCHASNALSKPGIPEAKSLSEVIHRKHAEKTNDCYKCHPGPITQCLRGVMATQYSMVCQDCHGSVSQVAQSISAGRRPWLDEPDCGQCHGGDYGVETGKLYRTSKGHGNLFCSACHGSPHAILPSRESRDNLQNVTLQGFSGTLRDCGVCHAATPYSPGPHGLLAGDVKAGQLLAGDFNGDGKDEMAGLTAYGQIYYTLDLANWQNIPGTLQSLVAGDLNGDGHADLAGIAPNQQIYYTTDLISWRNIPGMLSKLVIGDLNGDGRSDLAGLTADGGIYYTTDLQTWNNIPGKLEKLVTGDLDADGRDELAGIALNGQIYYSLDLISWLNIPGYLDRLISGDFNGDGKDDLAGITIDDQIFYMTDLSTWKQISGRLEQLVSGDFTGNRVDDVAGLTSAQQIFASTNLDNWTYIAGKLGQLTTGKFSSSGREDLAGLTTNGYIFYTPDLQNWIYVPGKL